MHVKPECSHVCKLSLCTHAQIIFVVVIRIVGSDKNTKKKMLASSKHLAAQIRW